jgi:CubicO group peptidase (beta-lactamase class C family)
MGFSDRDSAGRRARNVSRLLRRCGSEDLVFCARGNGRPKYFMRSVGTGYLAFLIVCLLVSCAVGVRAQGPKPANPATPSKIPSSTSPQPIHQMTRGDVEAFLDGMVPTLLQREDIAGAVLVIVKNGDVMFSKGYGYADVKGRVPVSPTATLFRPGSISKLFTWTAVMQLVEQGKLNLDHDVNEYLDFQVPHTFGRPVTVRNLMTHTPGFEEVLKDLMVDRAADLPSLQAFLIAHQPNQIYAPGTIPAYSNYGAGLAGYIVQRVSGMPFEEYVQANIFRPLGMSHATFMEPLPDSLSAMMSKGYELASQDPKPFELIPPLPAPDGSLSITGADMAPFMIAHLQNGKYGETRILQQSTAEMMHARQFSMDPAVNGMALGFYEESRNGHRIVGHGGDLNYFHSDLHLIADEGLGFFVSYNSAGKGEMDVRAALWSNFLDRYFPAPERKQEVAANTSIDSVSGQYLSSRRAQTTILRSLWWGLAESSVSQNRDGTVLVDSMKDFAGQPKRWSSLGNMQFREAGGQQLLVFKRDASGNLEMITDDPTEIFQRVPWIENKTVLLIALGFTALVFALTLVLWPVGALIRRHYHHVLTLSPAERRLRVLVKLGCAVDLCALLAFVGTMVYGFSNLSAFSDHFDPWLRVLQLLFLIGVLGTLVMLYSSYGLWRKGRMRSWTTVYTAGLVLASSIFLWFTAASRILQSSLKY